MMEQDDQDVVAAVLQSMPPPDVRAGFVARVNARIDEAAGWLGFADFRLWTLRLAPAAVALALVAFFWPASSSSSGAAAPVTAAAATFSPASSTDWQNDVTSDALLEAALSPRGGTSVR